MPHARFLVTRAVNNGTGTTFEAGQTYEMPQTSVDRWVRRGAAVQVEAPAAVPVTSLTPANDTDTADIDIPEGWRDLTWPELRALGAALGDGRSKEGAIEAVEAELERREKAAG